MANIQRIPKGLSGVAGEYFVAAELSRRGYIASITLRNTRGVDILAASADARRTVSIQVKTNQGRKRSWLLSKKVERLAEEGLFYVFVNLNGQGGSPTYHIVPSATVAELIRSSHASWLATPGRGGHVRKDTAMRQFIDPDSEWLGRWDTLGLG